jgi:hypothetical protein
VHDDTIGKPDAGPVEHPLAASGAAVRIGCGPMPAVPLVLCFRPHAAHRFGCREAARPPHRDPRAHPGPPSRRVVARWAGMESFPVVRFIETVGHFRPGEALRRITVEPAVELGNGRTLLEGSSQVGWRAIQPVTFCLF